MLLEKDIPVIKYNKDTKRYQLSFDLRRNIAKVITYYSGAAINKDILLDIFIDHETPNYFHGNIRCLLEILSQLLRHSIESITKGEISIRINHETFHQKNDSETKLSIIITAHEHEKLKEKSGCCIESSSINSSQKHFCLNNHIALQRIRQLCDNLEGKLLVRNIDSHRSQYRLTLVLHQFHPATFFSLA